VSRRWLVPMLLIAFPAYGQAPESPGYEEICRVPAADPAAVARMREAIASTAELGLSPVLGKGRGWDTVREIPASLSEMRFFSYGFPSEWRKHWMVGAHFRGPCAVLRGVVIAHFISGKRRIDIWQLRYAAVADATRVADLLHQGYWAWDYHPIAVVPSAEVVYVIEGRAGDDELLARVKQMLVRNLSKNASPDGGAR
jgi:hypothetical protein